MNKLALIAVIGGVVGALGAVVAALRVPDGPAAFRVTIAIAVLDVGLLIAATT